jgi:PmbA protein
MSRAWIQRDRDRCGRGCRPDRDPRISNSEGASFDNYVGRTIIRQSRNFAAEYRSSYCSLSTSPVAREGESMERDYWYTMARGFSGLEAPEHVGRMAAQRALRRLNAVKVDTQRVPVVFEPRTARSLLDHIFEAVHGMRSTGRNRSSPETGVSVAGHVTVTMTRRSQGSSVPSVDDEGGVAALWIERVCEEFGMNNGAARKLGSKTTGNASRPDWPPVMAMELFLNRPNPGMITVGFRTHFCVTELMGFWRKCGDRRSSAGAAWGSAMRAGGLGQRSEYCR